MNADQDEVAEQAKRAGKNVYTVTALHRTGSAIATAETCGVFDTMYEATEEARLYVHRDAQPTEIVEQVSSDEHIKIIAIFPASKSLQVLVTKSRYTAREHCKAVTLRQGVKEGDSVFIVERTETKRSTSTYIPEGYKVQRKEIVAVLRKREDANAKARDLLKHFWEEEQAELNEDDETLLRWREATNGKGLFSGSVDHKGKSQIVRFDILKREVK